MPVPTSINDLSTTASSNSPAGSESPITTDNYLRALSAFIAQNRDNKLARDGSQAMTGLLTLYNGIKFPATHVPSADPNVLDDYEEGAYVPVDASGGGLSLSAAGRYVKWGSAVYVAATIIYPATANTDPVAFTLPFPSSTLISRTYLSVWALGLSEVIYAAAPSGSSATGLYTQNPSAALTNASLSGRTVYVTGTYIATA